MLREGDPLFNLTDTPATSAGDEALGNSVSGVHLLDDGRTIRALLSDGRHPEGAFAGCTADTLFAVVAGRIIAAFPE